MINHKEIVAIIPARGGSKGLPRKNVRLLNGKPLISHVIDAARASSRIDRIVVSTDDGEIAEIAARFGAEVIDRPAELATDTATSEAALLHALDQLYPSDELLPEMFVFLQCTSPLTTGQDIDALVDQIVENNADAAFLATRFEHFIWRPDDNGLFVGVNHDASQRLRRQDRIPDFLETGAGYAMRVAPFRKSEHRFCGRVIAVEMPICRAGEIDTLEDFNIIERRMHAREPQSSVRSLMARVEAVVMDFDGVMTDDMVMVSQDGEESVRCSRADGMGIQLLRAEGIPMIVLSREENPVVRIRCDKLRIECIHGLDSKIASLQNWTSRIGADLSNTIYVGNDVNDLECMAAVGIPIAPADAHPAARKAALLVLQKAGGKGAVREVADMILEQRRPVC